MVAIDWTSGIVTLVTQLVPGMIAVGLALVAALAARTKAMPTLVFAGGLSAARSPWLGFSWGCKHTRTPSRHHLFTTRSTPTCSVRSF